MKVPSPTRDVVIKMSWLPSEKIEHEVYMLRYLNSHHVPGFPKLLGKLQVSSKMMYSHAQTSAIMAALEREPNEPAFRPPYLATIVLECPIGEQLGRHTGLIDLLTVFKDVGIVLHGIANAGAVYGCFDFGSVLLLRRNSDDPAEYPVT